mgnify:FL=1|tara:strand:- start:901 stop:1701 length:801 start_codon:yes stop_codon:yes gene_type:complete
MSDSYIGVPFVNRVSPNFLKEDFDGSNLSTVNGHANSYELTAEVPGANAENLMVVIDNVIQQPDVAYVIRDNASSQPKIINFQGTLPSTASIYVVHRGIGSFAMKPPTGSVGANELATNLTSFTTDTFTGNGSTTAYTLSETPPNSNSLLVFVDGILQKVTTNFTLSGNTLTFTGAPDTGAEIEIKHLAVRSIIRRAPDFQLDTFTGDGTDTTFTLANHGVPTNSAFVFVNGSAMKPTTDYAISGSVLTFTSAPANSAVILVRYQI